MTLAAGVLAGCGGRTAPSSEGGKVKLNGAGATFPYPIYSKWFSEYNKLHPEVEINYQSIGSGGGVRQLIAETVSFGASDFPMTDEQMTQAAGKVLHFPAVLGAVVPVYNVAGTSTGLRFTGPLLADIFLGKITKWNDPAIAKVNPGLTPPAGDITVVHRSDGSGTSFIWVDYLAKVSPEWKQKVGVSSSVNWPVGVGGKGNEGVAGLVTQTPGSIGYIELVYALQNKIATGAVQNAAGEFITPNIESVTAAAAGAATSMPKDFRVSITDAPGPGAYPVSSFTWILLYEDPSDKRLAKVLTDFMKWALTDGQKMAATLGYAPLPANVVQTELEQLNQVKVRQ
ncbi:MAG: phosphate ABC transporter substrate-binding protein PstS [Vicinamibacterales bacterium]|nr:phosphate ABC transporter substrate-binding protein PstS [Vicinamibacterales bacterium]